MKIQVTKDDDDTKHMHVELGNRSNLEGEKVSECIKIFDVKEKQEYCCSDISQYYIKAHDLVQKIQQIQFWIVQNTCYKQFTHM